MGNKVKKGKFISLTLGKLIKHQALQTSRFLNVVSVVAVWPLNEPDQLTFRRCTLASKKVVRIVLKVNLVRKNVSLADFGSNCKYGKN